jgi:hypothetical protein
MNWTGYMRDRSANRFSTGKSQPRFPVKSAAFFVGAALLTVFVITIVSSVARHDVLAFLRDAQALRVYVNSEPAPNSEEIVNALKTLQPVPAHHSHPTTRLTIELRRENDVVTIECGRDSANAQEYWVFYPKYDLTSNNEIGRITTSALDAY